MVGAVVVNNLVENLIILNPEQIEELQESLQCEIVDAKLYSLAIGDLRTSRGWTRNIKGEQVVLAPTPTTNYDGYAIAIKKLNSMEKSQEAIQNMAVNEALAILTGETEE